MKKDKILDLLDGISEDYVNEAAPNAAGRKNMLWARLAAIAACFAVVCTAALLIPLSKKEPPENIPSGDVVSNSAEETGAKTETGESSGPITEDTETVLPPETETDSDHSTETESTSGTETEEETPSEPVYVNGLPVLKQSKISGGGFGYEGIYVADISELDNANPWDESTTLATLPVYKNLVREVSQGLYGQAPIFLSEEKMTEILYAEAERTGKEIERKEYSRLSKYGGNDDEYGCLAVFGVCEDVVIRVNSMGDVGYCFDIYCYEGSIASGGVENKIDFSRPIELSEDLIPKGEAVTTEELTKIVEFINSMYPDTMSLEFSSSTSKGTGYYVQSDDYTENLLNCYFDRYSISLSEDRTQILSFSVPSDASVYTEKLGDYPIIAADTAMAYLLAGDYVTTIPEFVMITDTISSEQVHKCELVYLMSTLNEYFMPYYKFYVRIKDDETPVVNENGDTLKHYGIFYVPAVREEYISDYSTAINGQWILN